MRSALSTFVVTLLLAAHGCVCAARAGSTPRQLTRQDALRRQRLNEVVKEKVKSAAHDFLNARHQSLTIPVEIDLLLLGFGGDGGDGGYGYTIDGSLFEGLLNGMVDSQKLCPTVWETGEKAAVCFQLQYLQLPAPKDGLRRVEAAIKRSMRSAGSRSEAPMPGWAKEEVQLYDVAADGAVEDTMFEVLTEAYKAEQVQMPEHSPGNAESLSEALGTNRMAIVLINPVKYRMTPLMGEFDANRHVQMHSRIMEFWLDGHFSGLDLAAYEAKYNYRYSYYHRGTSASWVSRHNFAVIDVSAGPVLFGPQTSPGGKLEPPSVPRILPGLMKMANEMADAASGPSSARREIIRQASLGGSMLLQGQLAACVSAAVRHVFVPDLRFERLEHARNVLVPLIALYDDPAHDPLDNDTPSYRRVMHDDVEGALRILLDPGQSGFVESRSKRLQDYPAIASALHKARVSRSDAVLLSGEGGAGGVHTSARVHVDAATLLRELQMAIPSLSDGTLTLDADDAASRTASWELPQLRGHARHDGTRVLPVFILTLTCSPEQMLFDNRQLVAADHDSVVVLQLVRPGSDDDDDVDADGSVFSGHVLDGLPLRMDAAGGLTANVLAGVAMGLAGIVPPYERHDASGSVVQDWRWGVGALPWGPHAHSFELSRVYSGVAKRNFFISHLELAVRAVQSRLARLDALVGSRLSDPFGYLFERPLGQAERVVRSVFEGEDVAAHVPTDPRSRLGALASMSPLGGYNTTFPENVMGQLEVALGEVESGLQAVTWDLWSQDWDAAQASLEHVLAAVDLFTKRADADLVAANAAAECCRLDHSSGTAWSWVVGELSWVVGELELGVELLAVGALALLIAACMAVGLVRSCRSRRRAHAGNRAPPLRPVEHSYSEPVRSRGEGYSGLPGSAPGSGDGPNGEVFGSSAPRSRAASSSGLLGSLAGVVGRVSFSGPRREELPLFSGQAGRPRKDDKHQV